MVGKGKDMNDKDEYFKRQIDLWGENVQNKLEDKKIAIIGCGGLGSTLGITLGSSGIGEIHLIDFDIVNIHNIHRQIAYTLQDDGKYKCKQLASLIQNRNKYVKVKGYTESFAEFILRDNTYDLIIDATDNFLTREEIDIYAKSKNIPWLYGSVEGFNGYVCLFEKEPFKVFKITERKPGGITPPIVAFIASLQANYALRYLADLHTETDVLNYLYFDQNGALKHKKFNL